MKKATYTQDIDDPSHQCKEGIDPCLPQQGSLPKPRGEEKLCLSKFIKWGKRPYQPTTRTPGEKLIET